MKFTSRASEASQYLYNFSSWYTLKMYHKIKRCLLLGRKAMTNLDSILKSREIILLMKVRIAKAMFFLVIIYGCESSTVKKTVCQRTDAFELWCWRRLLRVPRTARRSNQSILKEINPEYSLERLMLKLKLQSFGYLMRRTDLLEKTLMLGKIEGGRRRGRQRRGWDGWMASPTQWMWVWVNSGSWWWTGRPGVLQSMGSQRVGHDWATELTEPASQHSSKINGNHPILVLITVNDCQYTQNNHNTFS